MLRHRPPSVDDCLTESDPNASEHGGWDGKGQFEQEQENQQGMGQPIDEQPQKNNPDKCF